MATEAFMVDPLLVELGVAHGFGTRGAPPPSGLTRPRQVHGTAVVTVSASAATPTPIAEDADAIVCRTAGVPVAVVTADCVPILVANAAGDAVAAIHAGWRGLAAGVVERGVARLGELTGEALTAAVGPHARACCYEVDAPVVDALGARFGDATRGALRDARPGHHWLDLERLVVVDLARSGVAANRIGRSAAGCTVCDAGRFESYRRDGAASGRLVHWIAARRRVAPPTR